MVVLVYLLALLSAFGLTTGVLGAAKSVPSVAPIATDVVLPSGGS